MQQSIVVTVEFHIRPDTVDRWLRLAIHHLETCVRERGMSRFWIHRDDADPAHFLFYEEWADRSDLDRSMAAPWRGPYVADTQDLWAGPREMTVYRRVETPWQPLDAHGRAT